MASCCACRTIFACFQSELHDDNGQDDEDSPIVILSHRKTEPVESDLTGNLPEVTVVESDVVCELSEPLIHNVPSKPLSDSPTVIPSHRKIKPVESDLTEDLPEMTVVERISNALCEISKPLIHIVSSKPLSVMEINKLLEQGRLEEAYPHMQSLRMKFQREHEALGEKTPFLQISNEEKDLSMLYETLRTKVIDIIKQPPSLASYNKKLLEYVTIIIQEEKKRKDVGRLKGWGDVWKSAVQDGVRDTIKGVQLDSCEENASWLAVHLGHLGKEIVELLEKVKTDLLNLYPASFNVFETYVSSCHKIIGEHLKELLGKITELKDYYAMLDFTINQYHGEKILGSPSLQPEMRKQMAFTLPDPFLDQIKDKYCNCLQEELKSLLSNIIKVEKEDVWMKKDMPKNTEDGRFIISEIHIDICKLIASYADNSGKIDESLKRRVLCSCLEALKHFPNSFEKEFTKQSSSLLGPDILDCCLYCKYHVVYANTFSSLREHVESYRESCPDQVEELGRELDKLLLNLRQALLKQFRAETEAFMKNMMTRTWLKTNDDFKELKKRLETYSGFGTTMRPLAAQSYANDLHYHVVKEYITQLLKKEYSCKGNKNKSAAEKIRDQWDDFKRLFSEMGSTLEWLHPLGDQLSLIIEQKNERDITNLLEPFFDNYPDISENQLTAILYFRNNDVKKNVKLMLNKNTVIQHFIVLKAKWEKTGEKNLDRMLFSDINGRKAKS
uniref:Si:dkey-45k15.1 n=1 Tax=Astyanax mexicanus TaxID=7994 RepID=A0A8B9RHV3_ASTMX